MKPINELKPAKYNPRIITENAFNGLGLRKQGERWVRDESTDYTQTINSEVIS